MQDQPTPPEILDSVAAFLRADLLPALEGAIAFQLRVAIGAIELVRREIVVGGADAERERLRALLGRTDGTVEQLTAELARALLDGGVALDTPGVVEHLWRTTEDKLAVDQPGYAGLARAKRLRGEG